MLHIHLFAAEALVAAALLVTAPAIGQDGPPKEHKGYKAESLAVLDLGPELDGMQGRQLRLRLLTIEPGGWIALHAHKDRPAVARVVQGALVDHIEGRPPKERKEGESW